MWGCYFMLSPHVFWAWIFRPTAALDGIMSANHPITLAPPLACRDAVVKKWSYSTHSTIETDLINVSVRRRRSLDLVSVAVKIPAVWMVVTLAIATPVRAAGLLAGHPPRQRTGLAAHSNHFSATTPPAILSLGLRWRCSRGMHLRARGRVVCPSAALFDSAPSLVWL